MCFLLLFTSIHCSATRKLSVTIYLHFASITNCYNLLLLKPTVYFKLGTPYSLLRPCLLICVSSTRTASVLCPLYLVSRLFYMPFVNRRAFICRQKHYKHCHKSFCFVFSFCYVFEPNSLDGKGMCLIFTIINKLELFFFMLSFSYCFVFVWLWKKNRDQ